jgi:DNA-binding SARP family transcriptional activator
MTGIVTIDSRITDGRCIDNAIVPALRAPQKNDSSQRLVQLVHIAAGMLRHGQVHNARQVLEQACALAPINPAMGENASLCDASAELDAQPIAHRGPRVRFFVSQFRRADTRRPLRIWALGGFEICRNGVAFASGIKPQRRPLDLLKLLLSSVHPIGAGELADKLWPDSEGDTARNCLQVAVHRLRKLLGHEEAVQVHDRKLHLNRELCWVDLWDFEAEAATLTGMPIEREEFRSRAARVLQLYRGPLFAHEVEQGWMLGPRERARCAWLDLVRQLGRHHEIRGDCEAALHLYQRAVELDPVAEDLYRRLMLCQHTMGWSNEALITYQNCRKQLAAALGTAPSAQTERLHQVLCNTTRSHLAGRHT